MFHIFLERKNKIICFHFIILLNSILIEGLSETVAPIAPGEVAMYEGINFDIEDYKKDVGTAKLINDGDKVKTLMARWRYNSLSIHGIEVSQAFSTFPNLLFKHITIVDAVDQNQIILI